MISLFSYTFFFVMKGRNFHFRNYYTIGGGTHVKLFSGNEPSSMPVQWEGVTLPNLVVTGQKLGINFVYWTQKPVFSIDFVKKLTNFRKIKEVIQQKLRSCSISFNFLCFITIFLINYRVSI